MARLARKELNGNYFHILVCGIPEANIFAEHKFKNKYIALLQNSSACLLGYCILENHAHIVYYADSATVISKDIKAINTAFAIYYNKTKNRNGYVFGGRFRSQSLASVEEAAACIGFVHMNPIFDNPRFSAKTYPYSSYKLFVSEFKGKAFLSEQLHIPTSELLAYIEGASESTPLVKWMDVTSFKVYEDYETTLDELKKKYAVDDYGELLFDKERLGAFAVELKKRTGAPLLFISELTGIGRETLRRAVVKYTASSDK